jgi:hypothetical protein
MNILKQMAEKKASLLLVCCWIVVQLFFLTTKGIILEFEAGKYIDQARLLLNEGHLSAPNLWFYSFQIFLLAIAIKTKIGFISIYLLQLLINGASTIVFYKLCTKLSSKGPAFIATLLLVLNLPLQEFNIYLQTESIFISFTIFFSYFLLSLSSVNVQNISKVALLLFILSVTRPNGLMIISAALIFLYLKGIQFFSFSKRILASAIFCIGFLYIINFALGSGGEWRFMLAFQKELVLCADTPYFTNIKISDNPHSIEGFAYYITHNFQHFIRLALLKTIAFWGLFRSYFSTSHNLFLIIYFYPIYLLIILSFPYWLKRNRKTFIYLVANIFLAWFVVMLTCDDVHNRFFLVLSPYLYLLSLPMLQKIHTKISATNE